MSSATTVPIAEGSSSETESSRYSSATTNGGMKLQRDGLTRVWRVHRSCDPFFSGGKVEVAKNGRSIVCMNENNINVVPIDNEGQRDGGSNSIPLFSKEDAEEFVDTITCFSLHPTAAEVVLATQKGVLRQYALKDNFRALLMPASPANSSTTTSSSDITGSSSDSDSSDSSSSDSSSGSSGVGECLRVIKAHQMPVLAMNFDASGRLLATGAADRRVCVWDLSRGYCTHSFRDHGDILHSVQFHPDADRLLLVTTAEDRSLRVFDLRDSSCIAAFEEAHVSVPTAVAFAAPDGYLMASTGRDKVLCFYELREMRHIKSIPLMEELESCLFLDPEHSHYCTTSSTDTATATTIPTTTTTTTTAGAVSKKLSKSSSSNSNSSSGQQQHVLLTAGELGVIRIFAVSMRGKDSNSFRLLPLAVLNLSSNSSSRFNGEASTYQQLRGVLSLHYIRPQQQQQQQQSENNSCGGSEAQILVVTKDHNFCFYTIKQLGELCNSSTNNSSGVRLNPHRLLIGSHGEILDMALIPPLTAATTAVAVADSEGSNSQNQAQKQEQNQEQRVQFRLALVTNSPQLRLLDENFNCCALDGHRDIVLAVDASPDGHWVVTSSKDQSCRVWSVQQQRCVATAVGHTDAVGCVAISRSLHSVATRNVFMLSGGGDRTLKRWPLPVHSFCSSNISNSSNSNSSMVKSQQQQEQQQQQLSASHSVRAHDKDINAVCCAPSDLLIATASQDKLVKVWNATDLSLVATLRGHKRGVWKVQFSPVEKLLVSCSGDRTVKIWSVGELFGVVRTLDGHTASVLSVRFVNHGLQLMSAAADGLMRLWTVRTGECEATFEQHEDRVWALEALDIHPTTTTAATTAAAAVQHVVFSGGSESRLLLWRDCTAEDEQQRVQLAERAVLLEQQMGNDIRAKRFDRALMTALELGHSLKVLNILRTILETDSLPPSQQEQQLQQQQQRDISEDSCFHQHWARRLDAFLRPLNDSQLQQLLSYVVDWNTNSKHCYVSQLLLGFLLRTYRIDQLLQMKAFVAALPALEIYSQRHFQRLDRLNQASYMLEFFTSQQSGLMLTNSTSSTDVSTISTAGTSIANSADAAGVVASKKFDSDLTDILFNRNNSSSSEQQQKTEDAKLVIFSTSTNSLSDAATDSSDDSDNDDNHYDTATTTAATVARAPATATTTATAGVKRGNSSSKSSSGRKKLRTSSKA